MNVLVYLVPIPLPSLLTIIRIASWHVNRKRIPWIPPLSSHDPCGAKVRDPSIFMHVNSTIIRFNQTWMANKLEIHPLLTYLTYLLDLLIFGFILPSLTSLDHPYIVAHPAEPDNLLVWVLSSHQMILLHPSHPASAPTLSDAWLFCVTETLSSICRTEEWEKEKERETVKRVSIPFLVES